jgi:phosphopentomutase
MDELVSAGCSVITIGKLDDIFGGRGITQSRHTLDNRGSTSALLDFLEEDFQGLLFANLIEWRRPWRKLLVWSRVGTGEAFGNR